MQQLTVRPLLAEFLDGDQSWTFLRHVNRPVLPPDDSGDIHFWLMQ